mmetsp:Transcript_10558/g.13012  ORF Transcript_10558/g.13012 Transcript_10558/m.13012 type:complete len:542 (+) Transcript_10558:174-1799(+)|eukprot:CAMPEP_0172514642 /NCGR_PEP_ID=MMETSP1066-20121228/261612_1 /TAXON_ID=671091 /ORGANISM="Coscinodiscus wailesii, Strain CCMP2513" /LENGTH=541 /DNA_ID=CAMNT_0013295381 /DNA_START=153 /DNA_END=1778 /DNA_ORIENTATION=-
MIESEELSTEITQPMPEEKKDSTITAVKPELLQRLEKEQELSKINRREVETQWRKVLRRDKLAILQKDLEKLQQSFEAEISQKNTIIETLQQGFEQAEDQFERATGIHLQSIDTLIDLHDDRLLSLEQDFTHNLTTLRRESAAERAEIEQQHEIEQKRLRESIAAIKNEEEQSVAQEKRDQKHTIEEISNRNLEEINGLRVTLESKIETLEEQFDNSRNEYLESTEKRTADFKVLTEKEKMVRKDMEQRMRQIDQLQNSLAQLRQKHANHLSESKQEFEALMERKRRALENYQALKNKMNRFRGCEHNKLIAITKSARSSKELLREKMAMAERIVTLAQLCAKMETDHERIIPYLNSALAVEQRRHQQLMEEQNGQRTLEDYAAKLASDWRQDIQKGQEYEGSNGDCRHNDRGGKNDIHEQLSMISLSNKRENEKDGRSLFTNWSHFDPFWKKYNKVLLDALIVEKKELKLKKEYNDLQAMLKKFMDGISINDDVIRSNNPLLVVNGRVQPSPTKIKKEGKFTIVDANHVVMTSRARDTML